MLRDTWNKCAYNHWEQIHQSYDKQTIKTDDWLMNYDHIIERISKPIIDLGCGSGNDTLYLMEKGKKVIACDQSENAIRNIQKNFPDIYDTRRFNMLDTFPVETQSCELVIADLCLHYFTEEDTNHVIQEIKRILTAEGYLLFRVNSVNDINHGAGKGTVIERNCYQTEDGMLKRFFDEEDITRFFREFRILSMQEKTMTRYRLEKQLYEVCVQKVKRTA